MIFFIVTFVTILKETEYITLYFTTKHSDRLYYMTLWHTLLHYITLHHTTLYFTNVYYITVPPPFIELSPADTDSLSVYT